ncbi:MAG: GDP-mannose 4,6-dehydratase [Candidatus Omnitrophica bacterium]|nr:GDP-mannose 4,6-dehydratase [Candidatus Omnitrophota bacterium]MBU1997589.1 GDP-mannose 4,6-dehydratase [Candidatus Omnitrophota bacterium]MBU4334741.1 GDP-mannose 4,6-dehydratase [Candidatus Omnitrophota bacterium]
MVAGHTGVKGSWLALWLAQLGAEVSGYSKYIPTDPSHFEVSNLKGKIANNVGDITDIDCLRKVFDEFLPEIVFHLAAQPIVRDSYNDPKLTFDTNLGGTVNVLECIKSSESVKAAVIITSDKCYENIEQNEAYKEQDRLGGKDPYSASKACAEIAFSAYFRSFFKGQDSIYSHVRCCKSSLSFDYNG